MLSDDDLLLAVPRRTIRAEYDRERRFLRWRWTERVRRTFVIRARPIREMLWIAAQLGALYRAGLVPNLDQQCALLVGKVAYELPLETLEAIYEAHREVNRIPKATPREAGPPSPTATSSEGSDAGPSTSDETRSST